MENSLPNHHRSTKHTKTSPTLTISILNDLELGSSSNRKKCLAKIENELNSKVAPTILSRAVEAFMMCIRDTDFHVVGGGLVCLQRLLQIQLSSTAHHAAASLLQKLIPEHRRLDIVTRLGHTKASVRNKALDVLVYAATVSREFQAELFVAHCNDNNWQVRLQMIQFLAETLARQIYPANTIVVELCTPILTVLMDDRNVSVRDAAIDALCVLNECDVDGVLLTTIRAQKHLKRSNVQLLFDRFHETATIDGEQAVDKNININNKQAVDPKKKKTNEQQKMKIRHKMNTNTRNVLGEVQPDSEDRKTSTRSSTTSTTTGRKVAKKKRSVFGPGSPTGDEPFALPMECDVIPCKNNAMLHQEMDLMESVLASKSADWNDRIRAMQRLQGLLLGGCVEHERNGTASTSMWKTCVDGLVVQLGDLRSKVVRQACATVSTLASSLGSKFHPYVEAVLPRLITLTGQAKMVSMKSERCSVRVVFN